MAGVHFSIQPRVNTHMPYKPLQLSAISADRQTSLLKTVEILNAELRLQPLLDLIARCACDLLDAEISVVRLVDAQGDLTPVGAVYSTPVVDSNMESPAISCLFRKIVIAQQAVLLGLNADRQTRKQTVLGPTSVLGAPIFSQEQMLGVLGLWAQPQRRFGDQDATLLSVFLRYVAIAVHNARRYAAEAQHAARLELTVSTNRWIATKLQQGELVAAVIQGLQARVGYDYIALYLLDRGDPTWLIPQACAGDWSYSIQPGYRHSIYQGIVGSAARNRMMQWFNDVTNYQGFVQMSSMNPIRAELAIPLIFGDKLLGVLDIASATQFQEDDVMILEGAGAQLAVAIGHTHLLEDTQRALQETELLYTTSQRISVALDVSEVVRAYLDQVATRGQYACTVAFYELDQQQEKTAVIVCGRWTPKDGLACPLVERIPYTHDELDLPLDAGQTIRIVDVRTDPRVSPILRALQMRDQRPALAMIPMLVRGRRTGSVILSSPVSHEWRADELRHYEITAAQLATAIDSRSQQSLLVTHYQQLAVLEERRRLARELHDSVTQLLFSITLIVQSLGAAWRRSQSDGERRTQRVLELSQAALFEMRTLLEELQPTAPAGGTQQALRQFFETQWPGLENALRDHVDEIRRDGLQIHLEIQNYVRLPVEVEQSLYLVVQEVLQNVLKHAHADNVFIRLVSQARCVYLTIVDNGVGFAYGASLSNTMWSKRMPYRNGIGLQSMTERVHALGGVFTVITAPGCGTTVKVVLPTNVAVKQTEEGSS